MKGIFTGYGPPAPLCDLMYWLISIACDLGFHAAFCRLSVLTNYRVGPEKIGVEESMPRPIGALMDTRMEPF